MAQLGHRGPAARLDREQRLAGLLRLGGHDLAGGTGLDDHHAHVVRHHVVQLTGDAGALVLDRAAQRLVALALQSGHLG